MRLSTCTFQPENTDCRTATGALHEVVDIQEGGDDAPAHLGARQLHQADLSLRETTEF